MLTPLEIFNSCSAPRDSVFAEILKQLKPQGIAQIGAIQCFRKDYRIHSGWSEVFWYNYLAENLQNDNGHLVIVDINPTAIQNSRIILTECAVKQHFDSRLKNVEFVYESGETYLEKFIPKPNLSYLLYLDGSDNPNEMLLQFQYGQKFADNILCDDWKIKGIELEKFIQTNKMNFRYYNVENGMVLIYETKNCCKK